MTSFSFPQKPLSKNEKATANRAIRYRICSAQRSPARRARTDTLFIVHLELSLYNFICVLALIYIYIYYTPTYGRHTLAQRTVGSGHYAARSTSVLSPHVMLGVTIRHLLYVVSELCSAAASCAASWRRSRRRRWRAWMTAAAPLSPSSARHRPVGSCGAAELVEPGLEFLESRSRIAQIAASRSEVGGEVVIPAARSAARSAADRLSGARYGGREGSEGPLALREGRQLSSHVESQPT